MTILDGPLGVMADQLIGTLGTSIVVVREDRGTFDPTTQSATDGTDVEVSLKGSVTEYRRHEIDGLNVLAKDRKLMIAGDAVERATDLVGGIVEGDRVRFGVETAEWRIVHIEPIQSGDEIAAYALQIRR